MVPGHETVGVIADIGPGAAARWGVDIGGHVAIEPFTSCLNCPNCLAGRARECQRFGMRCYGLLGASESRTPSIRSDRRTMRSEGKSGSPRLAAAKACGVDLTVDAVHRASTMTSERWAGFYG